MYPHNNQPLLLMMNNFIKTLLFLFFVLNTALASAVTIDAAVDRTPVNLNESIQLTFSAAGSPDADPDFEPLSLDFDIINQSHSSQSSWINGQSSEKIQWLVQLMPKHAGTIIIPAISFGRDKSNPVTVEISQAAATPSQVNTDAELFLTVDATPTNPYVQAQVLYTLRFYRRVNIAQARLDEPTLNDALVEKLGEDSNYNTQLNGLDYVITERKYAIFPQKSGAFTLAPLTLIAEVVSHQQPNFNGFFNSPITRTQRVSSNAITLNVQPAPAAAQAKHWLPAEDVQIQQEWSSDINQLKVGEPLTRTLSLVAKGTTIGVLPELNNSIADAALKNYPDQPTIKELQKPEGIYAIREEKIAFIASKAGHYALPAIEVPWFNIKTQQMQVASIPATTLNVAAAANADNAPATPNIAPLQLSPNTPASAQTDTPPAPMSSNHLWLWVALGLGIGWLTTLIYFLNTRRKLKKLPAAEIKPSSPDYHQALKDACNKNDMQLAKQALLQWGLAKYQVNSLGVLAEHCDTRLSEEIKYLNQLLYAPESNDEKSWQGKRLYQSFTEQSATQKLQRTPEELLEPLYRL